MAAENPFNAFYCKPMRDILPLLSGQELKVFVALATYADLQGKSWPGVRELAQVANYPHSTVSELLEDLQIKGLVACLRKSAQDPLTGKLIPDVWAISPQIMMVKDESVWASALTYVYTHRISSMPVNSPRENSAQADKTTEAEPEKQNQRSKTTAPEGAATLDHANTNSNTPTPAQTPGPLAASIAQYVGSVSNPTPTHRAQAQNSQRSHSPSPSSAAPSPQPTRDLSFTESVFANSVRREIADMSTETARGLIARYGVERVSAAVMRYKARNEKAPIRRPTGWIIKNLEALAKEYERKTV